METTAQWNERLQTILSDYQDQLDDMLILFDGDIAIHQERMNVAWQSAQTNHPEGI